MWNFQLSRFVQINRVYERIHEITTHCVIVVFNVHLALQCTHLLRLVDLFSGEDIRITSVDDGHH